MTRPAEAIRRMLSRVTDELKPPVAIRITRPYATEAEFLEREFDTLTHTSVVLLGAQARPQGVVLRFEIVLKGGESILRGEGRVVAYKERAYGGEPGLSLRFTRLDSRSKSLVDRASALRDARVKASTSLMSMPAVVVPKPAGSTPDLVASPAAPSPAPPLVNASEQAPRVPTPPARISTPPPARRSTPPPLPAWAKIVPPAPPSPGFAGLDIPIDVESTQVDAHFDLPPPLPAPQTQAAAVPVEASAVVEPVAAPAPARQPIRPTPSRPPPPLPASVPVRAANAGAAASAASATSPAGGANRAAQGVHSARPTAPAAESAPSRGPSRAPDRGGSASLAERAPNGSTTATAANTRERSGRETGAISRPDDREALLTRLRDRAHSLSSIRVAEILAKGTR